MTVTATEMKTNFGKYLELVENGDIVITRNGRRIARLVKAEDNTRADLHSLFGILGDSKLSDMSDEELKSLVRDERSKRYECLD